MSDVRRRTVRSAATSAGSQSGGAEARARAREPNAQHFDADPGTMMFSSWQALLLGAVVTALFCYVLFFDLVRDELAKMEARGETLFGGRKRQIPM